ncbi:hypothetical protein [Patulibacter minatonensis]|uniref:hypothetical protein n=1 Tax=Patulibacter minatonensis TaxID=298163 RepID=UPI00047E4961|nr:hypothetical protein [Patulibacter minatonensis]
MSEEAADPKANEKNRSRALKDMERRERELQRARDEAPTTFLDRVRKVPGLSSIPGGDAPLRSVAEEEAAIRKLAVEAGTDIPEWEEDHFSFSDFMTRVVALSLTTIAALIFLVGSYFWTDVMVGNIGPLGFGMTPIGMYGILIALIPVMGIIHALWTSSDVKRRKAQVLAAARDKLRVSLLSGPEGVRNVRAAPMPASMLFGESEEDLVRRRREQHQRRGE